jgi:NADH dehydrogenase
VAADGSAGKRPRVVIVGGGFGGLAAARALKKADVDITVVDRMNHHLFQPLLYQVAAGGLPSGECARPIRSQLKRQSNASVVMAEVTDIDVEQRQVKLDRGDRLDYDQLIFAAGAETSYFGNDELRDASFGLKTLEDAVSLREQIFSAFEQAERTSDPKTREQWMTFVVVGGGATGVEVAGALTILAQHDLKGEFTSIDSRDVRVILVDAGDAVVPVFDDPLPAKTGGYLEQLGVTVRHHALATAIDSEGVTIKRGDESERIAAKTVVWAAGVQAGGLAARLAAATATETDRGGRLITNPDLTLPGHAELFVIGDVAHVKGAGGKPVPGLATAAIQQGRHAAKAIRKGSDPGPFRYFDKGALAVVGRGKAVCEVRGRKLSGRPAFAMYLGVHLFYLGGGSIGRLTVFMQWLSARFGRLQGRVVTGTLADQAPVDQTRAGS